MSMRLVHALAIAVLSGECLVQTATAAPDAPTPAERLHARAVASFQHGRYAEAYGRFMALADAGHAPSADVALFMYTNGPTLFGSDWDVTQEQLAAWARLVGRPVPELVARSNPRLPVRGSAARSH